MFVTSLSTLPVDGFAWRPRFGGHAFVVIAKATFALRPGRAALSERQEPIHAVERHYDDDPAQSLHAPSDHVPFKDRVDVTMVGEAIARARHGSRALVTRLCVGDVDKRLVCFPNRWVDAKGKLHKGEAFGRMPLRYEHALGGFGSSNPVGVDPEQPLDDLARHLPNLEPFGRRRCEDEIACFGPIAQTWPSRRQHLRDATFHERDWPRHPLPESLEPAFFNVAPPDQRLDELPADAVILLENVHPHLPRLRSQLPGLRPRAFVERSGSAREVFLQADSLWIDTCRSLCTVTWRGSFDVTAPDEQGHVLVALEEPGHRLTWPDVAALAAGDDDRPSEVRLVAMRPRVETLVVAEPEQAHYDRAVGDDSEDTVVLRRPSAPAPALPFVAPASTSSNAMPPSRPAPPSTATPGPPAGGSCHGGTGLRSVPPPAPPSARPSSPWAAGSVSSIRHTLRPPPTAIKDPISPPPLLAVTTTEPTEDQEPSSSPEPAGHLRLIGHDDDPTLADRLAAGWPEAIASLSDADDHQGANEEPTFEEQMRRIFAPAPPDEPVDLERAIAAVLHHGAPHRYADLEHDARAAVDEDGIYRAPLVVLHGRLRLRFDEVATLSALLEAATPSLPDSERLSREVAILRKLQRQGAGVSAEVASDLALRLRQVCEQEEAVDAEAVERRAERHLHGDRSYQTRRLLGGRQLRGELTLAPFSRRGGRTITCYLPEAWRDALPLCDGIDARLIGALHQRQDQWETCPLAIHCVALGERVTTIAGKDEE